MAPFRLFGGVSDDAWRWLHLEGRDRCPFLESYLPGLTGDPKLEAKYVGSSGNETLAEGFRIYELLKGRYEEWAGPLTPSSRVLDFGCGFGRIIRFFLKDVAPENLIGIDKDEKVLGARADRWSQFQRCETFPPVDLATGDLDFVYAFSVFSHMSEEAHARWIEEFERLLKPGGVLILTTFPRSLLAKHPPYVAETLPASEPWLSRYDDGEFAFQAFSEEVDPHIGLAFISERYVRENWTKHFEVREYFEAPAVGQNVIVCQKR